MRIFLFILSISVSFCTDFMTLYQNNSKHAVHFYYRITEKSIGTSVTGRKKAYSKDYFKRREFMEAGLGSGFIIDKKGLFLTNNHVVSNHKDMRVRLYNGKSYRVKTLMVNRDRDIALLGVDDPNWKKLDKEFEVKFTNSSKLKVGQPLFSIGSYGGNFNSLNTGYICGLNKSTFVIGDGFENLIQINASLNKGNSGGALFDTDGNVIGMVVARSSIMDNVGYGIPANTLVKFIDDYTRFKKPIYNLLGIEGEYITMEKATESGLSDKYGVIVQRAYRGTEAHTKLRNGDIITHINDSKIKDPFMMRGVIQSIPTGDKVKISIIRNSKKLKLEIKINDINKFKSAKKRLFVEKYEVL